MKRFLKLLSGYIGLLSLLSACTDTEPATPVNLFPTIQSADVYQAVQAASEINKELIAKIGEQGLPDAPFVREMLERQGGELLKGGLPCQGGVGQIAKGKKPPNPCPDERNFRGLPFLVPTGVFSLVTPGPEYDVVILKGEKEIGRTGQVVGGAAFGTVKAFKSNDFSSLRGEVTVEVIENGKTVKATEMYFLTSAEVRQ